MLSTGSGYYSCVITLIVFQICCINTAVEGLLRSV
jgi:hypothetical protein